MHARNYVSRIRIQDVIVRSDDHIRVYIDIYDIFSRPLISHLYPYKYLFYSKIKLFYSKNFLI